MLWWQRRGQLRLLGSDLSDSIFYDKGSLRAAFVFFDLLCSLEISFLSVGIAANEDYK